MIRDITRLLVSLVCAAGIALPLSAQQDDDILLTLDRAVELALRNNESLLSSRLEEDRARARVREAYSEALPKLDFSSTITRNWALPEFNFGGQTFKVGTDNVINFGLDLSQTIYRGGQVGVGLRIARYFQQISTSNADRVRGNIVHQVHDAYYDVLLAEATLEVSTAAYDRAVVQHVAVQRYYEAGTVSDYDVLRARVEVTNARPPVTQARNRLAIAKADLKRLIGLPLQARIRCTGGLDVDASGLSEDIETAVEQALANRSDMKAARLQTTMNDAAIRLARGENGLDVSLSAGYLMQAQVNDPGFKSIGFNDFSRSWNTLINVSIPLFDGRQNSGRVMQAQADYELSRYVERQLGKQIEVDVTEAVLDMMEASERVRAGEEAVELASRGLSIAQVQFEGGVSTQLELIDAQFVLKQAETDHVTAKYDYATAAANLRNVLGMMDVRSEDR